MESIQQRTDRPTESDDLVLLDIFLEERINVRDMQALLASIQAVYFSAILLDVASRQPNGQPLSDNYRLPVDDLLWIERLEIGTPNRLRVKGKRVGILGIVTFLTALLGLPVAASEAYKNYNEGKKAGAEIRLIQMETAEKAWQLYEDGKITRQMLQQQIKIPAELLGNLQPARKILPPQEVVPLIDSTVAEDFGLDYSRARVMELLDDLGEFNATDEVMGYLKARELYIQNQDDASIKELQGAYARLVEALSPMSNEAINQLIANSLRG